MRILTKITLVATVAISLFYGCKKDSQTNVTPAAKIKPATQVLDSMVLTPGGWVQKSHVFLIEKGYHLDASTGHVLKVEDATGKVINDFGVKSSGGAATGSSLNLNSLQTTTGKNALNNVVPGNNGWTGFTEFYAYSPITYFSTNWVVPGNPSATNHSQTIFIFNAISNGSDIIQPVLQWGPASNGGGNYWSVANWYGWNNNQYFAFTAPISVSPGTGLVGIINNTGTQANGSYNYSVNFQGYTNGLNVIAGNTHSGTNNGSSTTVTFPNISGEQLAYETIESYNGVNYDGGNGMVSSTDYPTQADVQMTAINMQTGSSPVYLAWQRETGQYANVGEHANVINNSSSGSGEVDLYFHPQAPGFYYNAPVTFAQGVSGTSYLPVYSSGNPATSFSISPALPSGMTFNTTTGAIGGTPTSPMSATSYTVTGANASGNGRATVSLTINATPTGPYTFGVTTDSATPTYFTMFVNNENICGSRGTSAPGTTNNVTNTNVILLSNSTVIFQVTSGYMPTSAALYGSFGEVNGVVSGSNITFSNVNLTQGTSCALQLN